jgi:hypothetical protein
MPFKKRKPLGRRPAAAKSNIIRVAELIPEKGIRYNDLKEECDKIGIGEKAMNNALRKLQAGGTIVKKAVLTKSGSGTCYKRKNQHSIHTTQIFSNETKGLEQHMKRERSRDSHKLCLTDSQMHALGIRFKYTGRHKILVIDNHSFINHY